MDLLQNILSKYTLPHISNIIIDYVFTGEYYLKYPILFANDNYLIRKLFRRILFDHNELIKFSNKIYCVGKYFIDFINNYEMITVLKLHITYDTYKIIKSVINLSICKDYCSDLFYEHYYGEYSLIINQQLQTTNEYSCAVNNSHTINKYTHTLNKCLLIIKVLKKNLSIQNIIDLQRLSVYKIGYSLDGKNIYYNDLTFNKNVSISQKPFYPLLNKKFDEYELIDILKKYSIFYINCAVKYNKKTSVIYVFRFHGLLCNNVKKLRPLSLINGLVYDVVTKEKDDIIIYVHNRSNLISKYCNNKNIFDLMISILGTDNFIDIINQQLRNIASSNRIMIRQININSYIPSNLLSNHSSNNNSSNHLNNQNNNRIISINNVTKDLCLKYIHNKKIVYDYNNFIINTYLKSYFIHALADMEVNAFSMLRKFINHIDNFNIDDHYSLKNIYKNMFNDINIKTVNKITLTIKLNELTNLFEDCFTV